MYFCIGIPFPSDLRMLGLSIHWFEWVKVIKAPPHNDNFSDISSNCVDFHWISLIFIEFHWFFIGFSDLHVVFGSVFQLMGMQSIDRVLKRSYTVQKWVPPWKTHQSCAVEVLPTPNTRWDSPLFVCKKKGYNQYSLKKTKLYMNTVILRGRVMKMVAPGLYNFI